MVREQALKYAFSLFMVVIATYVRIQLEPIIQTRMPFGTYTLAVIVVAWVSGVRPALLALVASTVCSAHYIIPPEGSMMIADPADQIALGIFFTVGIFSITLFCRVEWQRSLALRKADENRVLNAELRKLNKQKDVFLSLLAHELRSPLAPIGNAIAIIEKSSELPGELHSTTRKLSKNFSHLVRLVNDLLDVSRFLRDAIQLRREPTNLGNCIATAADMFCDDIRSKQHRVTFEIPEQPVIIWADHVRVCQIVCNLLSNAIRYTPECGEIHVSLNVQNRHIELSIRDTGLGITPAIKEQIFTPFYQASSKQSRFAPGLGLGLTIVKKLVELQGGGIAVVSRGANTGSTFQVRFPVEMLVDTPLSTPELETSLTVDLMDLSPTVSTTVSTTDTVSAPASVPNCTSAAARPQLPLQEKLRVLIADDDGDTAETFSQLLGFEGFQTQVASDGLAAVQQCAKFQPHILLLDIGLPGIDGFEVAQRVRRECGDSVRIIAVSGWGAEADRQKGIAAGFDSHFLKPIRLAELLPQLVEKRPAIA